MRVPGIVIIASIGVVAACGGGDESSTAGTGSSAAGAAGNGGAAGAVAVGGASGVAGAAGAAAGAGGATVDPTGTYGLMFTPSFDNCQDLPGLKPSGGGVSITVDAGAVTATFTGWPVSEMTPLIGTASLPGTVVGDKVNVQSPLGPSMSVGGCTTQWMIAAVATVDGTAISGSMVFSRGASTSKACSDQGITPCPRSVNFFGTKN